MDRKQQRQNKRALAAASCTAGFALNTQELPAPRKAIVCDPLPSAPLSPPFITPEACPPPPAVPQLIPPPLAIFNSDVIAQCPTYGGAGVTGVIEVTVAEDTQAQYVFFQTIDAITVSQLNYLYTIVPSSSAAIISAALSGYTGPVQAITKLTDTQATELVATIQQSKFFVDTLAVERARASLVCQGYNDAAYAYCPTGSTGAYYGPSGAVPTNLPYSPTAVIASGTIKVDFPLTGTTGGQTAFTAINIAGLTAAVATANALAAAAAARSLRCIYPNDPQFTTCCTAGANCPSGATNNLGFTHTVPTDTLAVLPTLDPRVGSFSVTGDTVFSTISRSAANQMALQLALAGLNCYYPNEDVYVECPPLDPGEDDYNSPWPVKYTVDNLAWSSTGDTLNIPLASVALKNIPLNTRIILDSTGASAPGGSETGTIYYVFSATASGSTAYITLADGVVSHADYEAGNTGLIVPLTDSATGSAVTALILQKQTPGRYAYVIRGSVVDIGLTASVTASTQAATDLINGSTDCYWTNNIITVTCPAQGFTGTDNQFYEIEASPSGSPAYTSTIAAGLVISYDPLGKSIADALAAEQATAALQCLYCNEPIAAECPSGVNETIGITGGIICDYLAAVAQNTAIAISNIPANSIWGAYCCYNNEEVYNNIFCGEGAIHSATGGLNSQDNFSLPVGTIVLCATAGGPPPGATAYPSYYAYSDLYVAEESFFGCCTGVDGAMCLGATSGVTGIGTKYANSSGLFTTNASAAVFYDNTGLTVEYTPPTPSRFLIRKAVGATRAYRVFDLDEAEEPTSTTYTVTNCPSCSGPLFSTSVLGKHAVTGGASAGATALRAIFCGGTALPLTLYSSVDNPWEYLAPISWFSDSCGDTPFAPKTSGGTANKDFYIAPADLSPFKYRKFSTAASNISGALTSYGATCPQSSYPYYVYKGSTACGMTAGSTMYTSVTDAFLDNGDVITNWYTTQYDAGSMYSATGDVAFLNWQAPDTSMYSRPIAGVTAGVAGTCASYLNKVTIHYSTTGASDVCTFPWSKTIPFNSNTITLWHDGPTALFSTTGAAQFYTTPIIHASNLFKPGPSGSTTQVYVSEYTPSADLIVKYRTYLHGSPSSTLQDFNVATHKQSPFLQTGGTPTTSIWEMQGTFEPCTTYTSLRSAAPHHSLGCTSLALYSDTYDVFLPLTGMASASGFVKSITAARVFNDGVDASGLTAAYVSSTSFSVVPLNRAGIIFDGALVQTVDIIADGRKVHERAYVSSINLTTGVVSLTGPSTPIPVSFSDREVKVVGFKTSATGWAASTFSATGTNANKLKVGHMIYAVEGATAGIGYVLDINGSTVTYSNHGASNLNTLSPSNIYIYGKYFTQLWQSDNKANVITSLYGQTGSDDGYVFKDTKQIKLRSLNITGVSGATGSNSIIKIIESGAACVSYPSVTAHSEWLPTSTIGATAWYTDDYYRLQTDFYCDGTSATGLLPVGHTEYSYWLSCCDEAWAQGNTGVTGSVCHWKDVSSSSAAVSSDKIHLVGSVFYSSGAHIPISGDVYYVLCPTGVTGGTRYHLSEGVIVDSIPCFHGATTIPFYIDYTAVISDPGDPCDGQRMFTAYYTSGTGPDCNCGNAYINSSVTGCTSSYNPAGSIQVNVCTTACTEGVVCSSYLDCYAPAGEGGAFSIPAANPNFIANADQVFSSNFDFSAFPAPGDTASDKIAEATQLAQNLVNSFVRCYYLNEEQNGDECNVDTSADTYLIMLKRGRVPPGMITSVISQLDANQIAKVLANAMTICVDETIFPEPGMGCTAMQIEDVESPEIPHNSTITIEMGPNEDCVFTPVITVDSSATQVQTLTAFTVTFRKITICNADGENEDIYVPDVDGVTDEQAGQMYGGGGSFDAVKS